MLHDCLIDFELALDLNVAFVLKSSFISCRIMNGNVGQTLRHAWLGMEPDPLAHSDSLLKAYNRPEEVVPKSSQKWLISKNAIVSGLGLFGSKEGNADTVNGEAPPPKARRKRIVRKKVSAS